MDNSYNSFKKRLMQPLGDDQSFQAISEERLIMPVETFTLLHPEAFHITENNEGGFSLDEDQEVFHEFYDEMASLYLPDTVVEIDLHFEWLSAHKIIFILY